MLTTHRLALVAAALSLQATASLFAQPSAPGSLDQVIDEAVADAIDDVIADMYGGPEVYKAIIEGDLATLERHLKNGLDPNRTSNDPDKPVFPLLLAAVEAEQLDVIRLLVKHKADVNGRDPEFGITVFSQAAAMANLEMVNLLLELGADPKLKDKWGGTALEEAAIVGSAPIVKRLRELGLKTAWPLHVAAGIGDLETLDRLLRQPELINQPTPGWGNTPLMFAVFGGQVEATKKLLAAGANPNAPNYFDFFPLHEAAGAGSRTLCELLIQHGADVNARVGAGEQPLDWAYEDAMIAYLKSKGATHADAAMLGPTAEAWANRPNPNTRPKQPASE